MSSSGIVGRCARLLTVLAVSAAVPTPARGEEITLWHSYRAGEAAALDATLTMYRESHPGLHLRVLPVPAGAYSNKLRSAIPYGHGPDLFIIAHDELGDLIARDLIEPLAADTDVARFLPETVAPLRTAQRLWGLPMAYKSLALFYRTDQVATPPVDTDAMIRTGKRLTGDGHYGLVYQVGEPYFHAPWLYGFGGQILDASGTTTRLDTAAAIASGRFLAELAADAELLPADVNGALVTELFNRGKAAMVINGPWFVSEIADGVPYAVAELPVVSATGKPARPFLTVEALFVAKGRDRASVRTLAEYLTSDAAATVRARDAGQPAANRAAYDDPDVAHNALLATFRRQLHNSVPMPTAPLMLLVWEPMAEALRQIARGALPPEVALHNAQERIAILGRGLPEAASPAPYVALLVLGVLVLVALLIYRLSRGLWAEVIASRGAYAFVAPAAVGMILMVGIPFAMGVGVGFFAFGPGEIRFVGLAHFVNILGATDYAPTHPMSFYFTLVVTILWTFSNVALHVAIGFAVAMLINQRWLWGRGFFRVCLILPWAVPSYISALVFKGLFNKQLGAINAVLATAGIEPVGWFDSFFPAFCANLTTNVWLGFPFMMVTIMGALQAIPADLYDAARIDGAGPVRRFVSVTLPQVAPALLPAIILGTIWTFNMFNVVFLVSEGQPEGATDILVTEAYRWAFARNGRYGYAAAYSLVIFGILLVYTLWTRRLTRARA